MPSSAPQGCKSRSRSRLCSAVLSGPDSHRGSCSVIVLRSSLPPELSGVAIVPEVLHRKASKSIPSSRTEDGSSLVVVYRLVHLEKTELCPIRNLHRHAT